MKIQTKEDLEYLVDAILNNQVSFEDKQNAFETIRELIKEYILKKGDIPNSKFIFLYNVFKDTEIKKDEYIESFIKVISNHYQVATIEEKILMNNVLLILHILNGEFEWLKEYLKNLVLLNPYELLNNPEYQIAWDFLKSSKEEDLILSGVRELINNYFDYQNFGKIMYINLLGNVWNIKSLYVNKRWLEIFDDLVALIEKLREKDLIEDVMTWHFFAYHIYGNNIQTINEWRVFNEKVDKPNSIYYKEWGEKNNLPKPKKRVSPKKKKIGFLVSRIVMNSPMMVLISLIESLMANEDFKSKYEVYLYSMDYVEKQADDEKLIERFKKMGVNVYSPQHFREYGSMVSHLKKALDIREKIIKDKIDYLISIAFGFDISNFIFSNRSAPKQIYWSHGNCTVDIENIDERISHFEQECKEFKWKIFSVKMADEFLVGSKEDKRKGEIIKESIKNEYGKDVVILGTIGRYVKLDSEEYLKAVAKILKENPNAVYLAGGDGDIKPIKEKLKKYGIEDRFEFLGLVNPHIFGWVIDVWLDTFPLAQGNSRNEFMAKGNGAVVFGLDEMFRKHREPLKGRVYTDEEFNLILPRDEKEYVENANKIIKEKLYKKLGEKMKKDMDYIFSKDKSFDEVIKGI